MIPFLSIQTGYGVEKPLESFDKAKQILAKKYATMHKRETFYCGCSFQDQKVDWGSCGYRPKKINRRAYHIEWEHVVPVSVFGSQLPSWREGHPKCKTKRGQTYKGRKCATKINALFRIMQADQRNLVPVIGEINAARSNHPFGIIEGEIRQYGACDFEKMRNLIEPRPEIQKTIAGVYFYMDEKYPEFNIINPQNREVLTKWRQQTQ